MTKRRIGRPADTYRAARRNEWRGAVWRGQIQGPQPRPEPYQTAEWPRKQPKTYRPNGARECERRVLQRVAIQVKNQSLSDIARMFAAA